MKAKLVSLAAGLAAGLAAPGAMAAGKFVAPQGCEVYVTVQLKNCQVSQHYRCASDAPGDQWALYMDGDGPFYASHIDSETRWLESFDLYNGEIERLGKETDPASFTTLITTGRDDFDFETESDRQQVRRFVGHDLLTGERVVIDGVTLERTRFELTAFDAAGQRIWHRTGQQLIHRDWRLFWSDTDEFANAFGDRETVVDTPVDFAFPGEKGFLSTEPQFGCDLLMTEAPGAIPPGSDRERLTAAAYQPRNPHADEGDRP
ncbi:hypothetical protein [Albidovulum sp.]